MAISRWVVIVMAGLLIASCATMQSRVGHETKQALAPTGKLRVAFVMVLISATKDPTTGELRGVSIDLGKELAGRIGVPFEAIPYSTFPALIGGAKSGEWDVAFAGINPERAAAIDFSAPFMEVEVGYLVRAGVPAVSMAEVDRPGIRVGVLEKAPSDIHLSATLKNATLVRSKTADDLYAMLGAGKADVISTGKTGLFSVAAKVPDSRVLDGRIFADPIGIGVPKGRNASAAAYVDKFVDEVKAGGLVRAAIDSAQLRGVVPAAPK